VKILVACEESGRVTAEFRRLGHEAYSCDILPTSGEHPEWHIQGDVLPLLKQKWDMIIAFPPCTYMTKAGAVRMRVEGKIVKDRYEKAMQAKDFFMKIFNANCSKIAIENPIPMAIVGLPRYSQIIQPWYFGDPWTKKTCLWLKGLPKLFPSKVVLNNVKMWVHGGSKKNNGQPRTEVGFSKNSKLSSKTFPGIARAMAEQWGGGEYYGQLDLFESLA